MDTKNKIPVEEKLVPTGANPIVDICGYTIDLRKVERVVAAILLGVVVSSKNYDNNKFK